MTCLISGRALSDPEEILPIIDALPSDEEIQRDFDLEAFAQRYATELKEHIDVTDGETLLISSFGQADFMGPYNEWGYNAISDGDWFLSRARAPLLSLHSHPSLLAECGYCGGDRAALCPRCPTRISTRFINSAESLGGSIFAETQPDSQRTVNL